MLLFFLQGLGHFERQKKAVMVLQFVKIHFFLHVIGCFGALLKNTIKHLADYSVTIVYLYCIVTHFNLAIMLCTCFSGKVHCPVLLFVTASAIYLPSCSQKLFAEILFFLQTFLQFVSLKIYNGLW